MDRTQAATSRDPTRERVPGSWLYHRDSVTKLIRISVERSMEMRVGCLVIETARVIVQYATIVMAADIGSMIAAFWDRDPGSVTNPKNPKIPVSNLFSMTKEEMKDRIRLEKPDTSMRWEVETLILLH